jgi:tetratricopeptide (TPR) repeat protein
MSLTKRQKKIIIENCDFLSVTELRERTGVNEKEITEYLKLNKKKINYSTSDKKSQNNLKEIQKIEENKEVGFLKILRENSRFLLILGLGIILLYINGMYGDFVSDDYATIPNNPLLKSFGIASKSLTALLNYIVANMFGVGSPTPYHVLSLILFLVVCFLGFSFLNMVFGSVISKVAIALFAVHPINVEAVSWISGKPYLLIALFLLLGLNYFVFCAKSRNRKYLLLMCLSVLTAFYVDKPRPLAFPLLLLLFLFSFKNYWVFKIKFKTLLTLSFASIFVAFLFIMPAVINRVVSVNSGYNGNGNIFYNPLFQYPTAIPKYLQLMLVPVDLTLYHTMYILPAFLNWMILLSYLVMVVYFFFKDKRFFFALCFIFVALAPSMAPVKVSWLVAERYAFLGNIGFCLFLALCFEKLNKKSSILAVSILVCVLSVYSARTFLRNIDWQTNHKLWVNTVQISPNSHNAWNNIGDDYDKLNQYENAIKGFTQSVTVKPDYADAYHNRANIFYKIGRLDMARDSYSTALKISPSLYQTYFSLIQIDLMENNLNDAMNQASTLIKLQPNMPQTHYIAGVVLAKAGRNDDALKELNTALMLNPGFTPASQLIDSLKNQK